MKKSLKLLLALSFVLLIVSQNSCTKYIGGGSTPPASRIMNLALTSWGLISYNSVPSLSSDSLQSYTGTGSDSLVFSYSVLPGFNISYIYGNLNGVGLNDSIKYVGPCSGVPFSDTLSIAYDTIITKFPLRPYYSDTLFVTKVSTTLFVFNVRYADNLGVGVETDSFRIIRTHL